VANARDGGRRGVLIEGRYLSACRLHPPKPCKDFLALNEENLWLVKPPGLLLRESSLPEGQRRRP